MSSQLHLLKSNAGLHGCTPTEPTPFISVTNEETGCRVVIAATRAFKDPIYSHYLGLKPRPIDYVWLSHNPYHCYCAAFSKSHDPLFETWQHIHITLRHRASDNASYAFYPEFEYETGEALAHASLVGSLALGKPIPECYHDLIPEYGAKNLRDMLDPGEASEEEEEEMDISEESDDETTYDSETGSPI